MITLKAGQRLHNSFNENEYIIEVVKDTEAVISSVSTGKLYVVAMERLKQNYEDSLDFFKENCTYKFNRNNQESYTVTQVIENEIPMYSFMRYQAVARVSTSIGKSYITVLSKDDYHSMVKV